MSSMLEQLWPVFLGEVSEQLDTVEAMIIASNQDAANIDALFREFHTIKSSFSMVDFKAPMELAHACEDVLHGLRKNNALPDTDIRKYLLEAVDWIKKQLSAARPGNYPQDANEALLENLAPFRFVPDDSDANDLPKNTETTHGRKESATEQITEEKEALAVESLRIYSQSLDTLLTSVNDLVTRVNDQEKALADKRHIASAIEAKKNISKIKSGEIDKIDALKTILESMNQFRKELVRKNSSILPAVTRIQKEVLDLRIIPLSTIFNKLPRIVRQKAAAAGKQVQLVIDGGDIFIDKGMVEIISEPLIHLLHNAVIHGIESSEERKENGKSAISQINIAASEKGNMLRIEVLDDGKGIDFRTVREKAIQKGFARADDENTSPMYWLNFLFLHGLNSENINRETGLDIVKEQLSIIGGTIDIDSKPGAGTRFIMRTPVTVAIQSALLVKADQQTFALPARHVVEITEATFDQVESFEGQPSFRLRNNVLPIYKLGELLNIKKSVDASVKPRMITLIILRNDDNCIALNVDDVIGRRELFLRDIHPDLRKIPGINGISLLGNGNPVIILDCESIFKIAKNSKSFSGKPHAN